jgi:hypothetical protein
MRETAMILKDCCIADKANITEVYYLKLVTIDLIWILIPEL